MPGKDDRDNADDADTTVTITMARRDAGQAEQNYSRSHHKRGYYYQNGTLYLDGYPLSEWLNERDSW